MFFSTLRNTSSLGFWDITCQIVSFRDGNRQILTLELAPKNAAQHFFYFFPSGHSWYCSKKKTTNPCGPKSTFPIDLFQADILTCHSRTSTGIFSNMVLCMLVHLNNLLAHLMEPSHRSCYQFHLPAVTSKRFCCEKGPLTTITKEAPVKVRTWLIMT